MIGSHPFHVAGRKYIDAVRLAECQPLVVPIAQADELDDLLDLADGVLLTGSQSNVHPSHFGEQVHDRSFVRGRQCNMSDAECEQRGDQRGRGRRGRALSVLTQQAAELGVPGRAAAKAAGGAHPGQRVGPHGGEIGGELGELPASGDFAHICQRHPSIIRHA